MEKRKYVVCKVDGCVRKHYALGYCSMHHSRIKRNGGLDVKHIRHGLCKLPEYDIWQRMKSRCYCYGSSHYECYGGRGIVVCDRWIKDFRNFYKDIGPRPSIHHSLDRIDNNGNYEPGNVRWATQKEQVNNSGKVLNAKYWCVIAIKTKTQGIRYQVRTYNNKQKVVARFSKKDDAISYGNNLQLKRAL